MPLSVLYCQSFKCIVGLDALTVTSVLSILFPALTSVMNYRHLSVPLKTISVYFYGATALESVAMYMASQKQNNLFLLHLLAVFEFWVFTLFTLGLLKPPRWIRGLLLLFCIAFTLFAVIFALQPGQLEMFNSLPRSIEAVYLLFLSSAAFVAFANRDNFSIYDPAFLITTGTFFYFGGNIVVFWYYNNVIVDPFNNPDFWDIHSTFNIAANIIFGIAFLCKPILPTSAR